MPLKGIAYCGLNKFWWTIASRKKAKTDTPDKAIVPKIAHLKDLLSHLFLEITRCVANAIMDGIAYWTRIYYYDGWVRELYGAKGDSFVPEDGEEVLQGQALHFTLRSGLLTVTNVDGSGDLSELSLSLRGGEGTEACPI